MNLAEQLKNRHEECFNNARNEEVLLLEKHARIEKEYEENIDSSVLANLNTQVEFWLKLPMGFSTSGQCVEWEFATPVKTTLGWTEGFHERRLEALRKIAREHGFKDVWYSRSRASRAEEGLPLRFISKITLWF